MADHPVENEIKQIFKRLLAVPTNKQCFDCGHSNPTWASVTYGVFLCIDCSAVHRSLGVHVTFIRSTQLDTNWTWLQLRAMQVGGNANARAFFQQHGCTTTDAQKKYHSRAATLYRDKLVSLAQHAMRQHGTKLFIDDLDRAKGGKLHIESHHEVTSPEKKEVDFFSEHTQDAGDDFASYPVEENARLGANTANSQAKPVVRNGKAEVDPSIGPNVEAALSTSPSQALSQAEQRKAIIGSKKPAAAKKGKGLGAQRVQKDFGAIESRAQQVDKEREELAKNIAVEEAKTKEEQEKQMASMRLAYQDMSLQRKKEEEKLMKNDPKKAEQFERLGMGFAGNKGVSHSALSDMQVINQETPSGGNSNSTRRDFDAYGEKPRSKRDFFDDEFEIVSSWSSKRTEDSNTSKNDDFGGWGSKNKSGGWDIDKFDDKSNTSETISQKNTDSSLYNEDKENERDGENSSVDETWSSRSRKNPDTTSSSFDSGDSAQKKFGSAKAISSDQYFGNRENDFEVRQNLSRLEGQSSISSDDFFGGGSGGSSSSRRQYSSATPDLQDIKDGVKQGVTKVAGKISSLANGVMSSLQDRYG
ncbi:ADP-ribosylation factor GTPase-activating protein 2 isoform X1 [Biomphalaria glabrata]|uniref:ADP-ribosylation factor GTPase-activating protein 2 isoform X1 n=2 Tax=Biomphalaria glabrata TaxID=6526 RepID=A0A9W3AR13_BIOGL|nr:ADP-ribosylation factor GTPase-activating protein 2 isoform X1 [Biomphalaria glabrata]